MTAYRVLKSIAFQNDDESAMAAVAGAVVDISDDQFARDLIEVGRIEPLDVKELPTGTVLEGDLNLVDDEEASDKPGKSSTNAELVDHLVKHGVKRSTVEHLTKAELLDAIERLTHSDDD